jgi:hypothetical protein
MDIDVPKIIENQLLASLAMLRAAIRDCPPDQLAATHQDYPFSQVAFHALFYCDFYLSESEAEFFNQKFHKMNLGTFDDYEELEYRQAVKTYDLDFLLLYVQHCKDKITVTMRENSGGKYLEQAKVKGNPISRLELFVDTARHTQHHAAQLGLRVQFLTRKEMNWIESGWSQRQPD